MTPAHYSPTYKYLYSSCLKTAAAAGIYYMQTQPVKKYTEILTNCTIVEITFVGVIFVNFPLIQWVLLLKNNIYDLSILAK